MEKWRSSCREEDEEEEDLHKEEEKPERKLSFINNNHGLSLYKANYYVTN